MRSLQDMGFINSNVFSIYTDTNKGNTSHITLGGYDDQGLVSGDKFTYIQTKDNTTWGLRFESVTITEMDIDTIDFTDKIVELNPAYQYIFLPKMDFVELGLKLNKRLNTLKFPGNACKVGTWINDEFECKIDKSCTELMKDFPSLTFKLDVYHKPEIEGEEK